MSFLNFFGDDRSMYAVGFDGPLLWYRDLLRDGGNGLDGERGWDSNSGNQIGIGWNGFEHLFAGGDGIIYGILESGELLWYRDLVRDGSNGLRGEQGWAPNSGSRINVNWNGFKHVFSGGDGIIYAVRETGELLWYQDLLRDGSNGENGERGWASGSGSQIGIGWNGFEHVFSGDNGIIYTIGNADLRWYQDLVRDGSNGENGESGWADNSGNLIGGAWGDIQQVFSGGGGVIYGIDTNDLFFSRDQRQDGQEGSFVDPGNRIGIERRFEIGDASAFLMVRGADNLHIGLNWWGFRLEPGSAAPASRPHLVARSDEATVTLTFPPQILSEPAMMPGDRLPLETHTALTSSVQFSVPAGTAIELNPQSVLSVLSGPGVDIVPSGPLGERTTGLEIPWHFLVTVTPQSGETVEADHVALPLTSPAGVTGLWHTRLRADDGHDTDARLWLVPLTGWIDDAPTALTEADRTKILGETTSGNGFPRLGRLELSALGGSLSLSAQWPDFEWDHDIVMGRDQHIRTLMTGTLYPFGFSAVTTTITERVFPQDPPPAPSIAALLSNSTLLIAGLVRPIFDRGFPFREAEILARRYDIAQPLRRPFVPAALDGQPLMFPIRCAGANGDVILHTPLVFVDDPSETAQAEALWEQFSAITLPGVPIDMVRAGADQHAGDVHEVHEIKIAGVLDDDGVHPTLGQFTVALPALRALMANTAAEATTVVLKYTPEFLAADSPPDLAFAPVVPVPIDFTDRPDRSGGLMAPRFTADAISRTLGPVPRDAVKDAELRPSYRASMRARRCSACRSATSSTPPHRRARPRSFR